MALSYVRAEAHLYEPVHVELSDWLADVKECDTTVCGKLRVLTAKAVGIKLANTDDLLWLPLSQLEQVEPCTCETYSRYKHSYGDDTRRERTPPPPQPKDPYTVLGLTAAASVAQITAAYRERMRLLHPDLNPARADPDVATLLNAKAVALNQAYATLTRK